MNYYEDLLWPSAFAFSMSQAASWHFISNFLVGVLLVQNDRVNS